MTFKYGAKPVTVPPRRLAERPKLSIRQIVSRVPNRTKLKSQRVAIVSAGRGRTPAMYAGYVVYKFVTQNQENGHRYRITIFCPTPKVTLDSTVVIDSPNPLFVFRYEYALARRGNALIYRSNGDPPLQTNPRLLPGVDHHTYRALQYLIRNTRRNGLPE